MPDGTALAGAGFIGGVEDDRAGGLAVDSEDNVYVMGSTASDENTFPVAVGPDLTHNGAFEAFVSKVGAEDWAIDYSGYIGGSDRDFGIGIDVDNMGAAYFCGEAISSEGDGFPLLVGPDLTFNGEIDAFAGALDATGTTLLYNGYIGGTAFDFPLDCAIDSSGANWVTGGTSSVDFPIVEGLDDSFNGGEDGFAAKVRPDGSGLIASTYIGGEGFDRGGVVAVDGSDNAHLTGSTESAEDTFPVLVGPDLTYNGARDAFVMKLDCPTSHEISGVFDAAGFRPLISPGAIVAIGGLFTEGTAQSSSVPLSLDLNGFSVTFNDKPGALFGVFDGVFDQANVQAPWDLDVSSGRVDVRAHWQGRDGEEDFWSEPFSAGAALASPGIFTVQFGPGPGVVTNFKLSAEDDVIPLSWAQPDGFFSGVIGQPAAIGGVITIWCNGLGPLAGAPPAVGDAPGDLIPTAKIIRVFIGGVEATIIGTPILHPTLVGLNQINVFVPDGVEPGDTVPIVIEVECDENGQKIRSRRDVTIAVRPAPGK